MAGASKLEPAFKKLYDVAKRLYAGDEWSITINRDGITINDGMDLLVEDADPEEAAEALDEAISEEE